MTQDVSSEQFSIKINDGLNRVGVSDEVIRVRRKCYLQGECNEAVLYRICPEGWLSSEVFVLGSQSEGTTTIGLHSDVDLGYILDHVVVITSDKDKHVSDMYSFRMDKFTNRGYCCIRDISFYKNIEISDSFRPIFKTHFKQNTSYVKNTFQMADSIFDEKLVREGPAMYYQTPYGQEVNWIHGFYCTSWPREVSNTFLLNHDKLFWPSDQLLQDVLQSKCFVVPKGSDNGPDSDIEWRLSFSHGERLLMFDLNIVQIRCYVLMKYVKTEFLDKIPDCEGIISSYICKTVLFHTVSQTPKSEWVKKQLVINFNRCLCNLQKFIDQNNCPHFIMPNNNLLANKLNEITKVSLSTELQRIIKGNGRVFFHVQIDDFGDLLRRGKKENEYEHRLLKAMIAVSVGCITGYNFYLYDDIYNVFNLEQLEMENNDIGHFHDKYNKIIDEKLKSNIRRIQHIYHRTPIKHEQMHNAIHVIAGLNNTFRGSFLASADIKYRGEISDEVFHCLLQGMNCTTVAFAHLKLASILFLIDDIDSCNNLIDHIREKYVDRQIVDVCMCKAKYSDVCLTPHFRELFSKKTYVELMRQHIAGCVIYLPAEINSCPKELQYEMYRSAFDEKPKEHFNYIERMYCASVPQLPFLYFMQYKLYKQMGKRMRRKCYDALKSLIDITYQPDLNENHLETAYNLIGQCFEQEGDFDAALFYYHESLKWEPVYNAAKILICCNLVKQLNKGKHHS